MNEQLTLNLDTPALPEQVVVYKDGKRLFDLPPAHGDRRERLVRQFRNNPTTRVVWEAEPRPTGWYGYKSDPFDGTTIYEIVSTPVRSTL